MDIRRTSREYRAGWGEAFLFSASASPSEPPRVGGFYSLNPLQQPPSPTTMLIKPHGHGGEKRGYRGREGDSGFSVRHTAFLLCLDHEKTQGVKETLLSPLPRLTPHHLWTSLLASREPGILAALRVSVTCTHTTGTKRPCDVSVYVCVCELHAGLRVTHLGGVWLMCPC